MDNRRARWISRHVDGEVPTPRRERIAQEIETSAEARRVKAEFEAIGERLREEPVPAARPVEAVWADVRRDIRRSTDERVPSPWVLGSRLHWAGAMMVIVLLGLGVWTGIRTWTPSVPLAATTAEVEWIETEVPGATTMLYQDEETGLTVIWMMEPDEGEQGHVET